MKIHSTHPSVQSELRFAGYAIRLTIGVAIVFCVAMCGTANAQSRLGGLTASPKSSAGSQAVRTGLFTHGDETYHVVDTAAFRTAADIGATEVGTIQQVGLHGECYSCGTSCGGSCGSSYSSCGSCGTQCGGSCGRSSYLSCGGGGTGNPCAPCDPYSYVSVEGLYMERDSDENFSLSPNFRRGDFDYEWGGRVTIGSVPDCVHGYEVSFTGVLEWDVAGSLADNNGGIQTLLTPGLPVAAANLSSFSNATFQAQTYSAEYWSVEANKTLVGWEMAKLLAGVRYINYDEDFNYFSRTATQQGLLRSAVENQLIGLQVGLDLLYPICRNGFADFRTRLGGFVDIADSEVQLFNNIGSPNQRVFANFDDDEEIAGVFEIGSGVRYQLGDMLSVRGGVELWYLTGIATATDQFNTVMRPTTGQRIRMNEDMLVTGVSFGAELRY